MFKYYTGRLKGNQNYLLKNRAYNTFQKSYYNFRIAEKHYPFYVEELYNNDKFLIHGKRGVYVENGGIFYVVQNKYD